MTQGKNKIVYRYVAIRIHQVVLIVNDRMLEKRELRHLYVSLLWMDLRQSKNDLRLFVGRHSFRPSPIPVPSSSPIFSRPI